MLYHIVTRNPHSDITLHVSANSPAMVSIPYSAEIVYSAYPLLASLLPVWVQSRGIHSGILRRVRRPKFTGVEECVQAAAPSHDLKLIWDNHSLCTLLMHMYCTIRCRVPSCALVCFFNFPYPYRNYSTDPRNTLTFIWLASYQ